MNLVGDFSSLLSLVNNDINYAVINPQPCGLLYVCHMQQQW